MFGNYVRELIQHETTEIDQVCRVLQHRNRPKANRAHDQIYMLAGSQLTQAKLVSEYLPGKRVVFLGDGDCMSLVIALLSTTTRIIEKPSHITVYDFDKRLLKFIRDQLQFCGWEPDDFECIPYNVKNPIPENHRERGEVFYTNPPYGFANKGLSGRIFLARCMELCLQHNSKGIAILPYQFEHGNSSNAMIETQNFLTDHGYVVSEMLRGMHQYDLDDRPNLLSGTVVMDRVQYKTTKYFGKPIPEEDLKNFYGQKPVEMPEFIEEEAP